jgi:hypothetical protein
MGLLTYPIPQKIGDGVILVDGALRIFMSTNGH